VRFAFCALQLNLSCAQAAESLDNTDPYVLLDAAKLTLADTKLERAARQLAAIPLGQAEPYVDEEIVLQRLLLAGAFLDSCTYLHQVLESQGLGDGNYARWLEQERGRHAQQFAALARDYLQRTQRGYALSFVRFRLPRVNEEHLRDVELYSDPQFLLAAAENWDQGRRGLGKGLILTQARIAVVLAAAVHYDLPEASQTLRGAERRLEAGVPLRPALLLDWIAETASHNGARDADLRNLAREADTRMTALPPGQVPEQLSERLEARRNPSPLSPPPPAEKPVKKSKGRQSNKRKG
jgi:hypothetical protein